MSPSQEFRAVSHRSLWLLTKAEQVIHMMYPERAFIPWGTAARLERMGVARFAGKYSFGEVPMLPAGAP